MNGRELQILWSHVHRRVGETQSRQSCYWGMVSFGGKLFLEL